MTPADLAQALANDAVLQDMLTRQALGMPGPTWGREGARQPIVHGARIANSSGGRVAVDQPQLPTAGPVPAAATQPTAPPAGPVLTRDAPVAPDAPVLPTPQAIKQRSLTPCDFGLCAEQTATQKVGGTTQFMVSPRGVVTPGFNPNAPSWSARLTADMALAEAGLAPRDWNNEFVQNMQRTPQFNAYVQELAPIFGNAAWTVATDQMAKANGTVGNFINSDQFGPAQKIIGGVGDQAQALATVAQNSAGLDAINAAAPGILPSGLMFGPDGSAYLQANGVPLQAQGAAAQGLYEQDALAALLGTNALQRNNAAQLAATAKQKQFAVQQLARAQQLNARIAQGEANRAAAMERAKVRAATSTKNVETAEEGRNRRAAAAAAERAKRDAERAKGKGSVVKKFNI